MYLIFDTETTGIPRRKDAPLSDLENWPRLVQLAWQLHHDTGKLVSQHSYVVKPEEFDIPFKAEQIHGISTARALQEGHDLKKVFQHFEKDLQKTKTLVGHNIEFDINIIGAEYIRQSLPTDYFLTLQRVDTGLESIQYCQLKLGPGKFKMPKLSELYNKLFGVDFDHKHDAFYDVNATAKSFFELMKQGVIAPFRPISINDIEYEEPIEKPISTAQTQQEVLQNHVDLPPTPKVKLSTAPFSHLHNHSHFSILQATPSVQAMLAIAKEYRMPAVALTDLGNMYGVFKFVAEALRQNIKPIVGCEFFISNERKKTRFTKNDPDRRHQQTLLAKNKEGYLNLAKLSSLGFTEGLYGIYPRIDKELVATYRKGLIATTGGLSSEISYLILYVGEKQAETVFQWWHDTFKDDFYVELNRHGLPEEDRLNETLLRFCKKYGVHYFAANESYYLKKEEHSAHDILLCIKEGELRSTPIGRGKFSRRGMPNEEFYFKTQEEMKTLFHDLPQAIDTTNEIVNKVETYDLRQPVLLPKYAIPKDFIDEDTYLRHLTYEGAKKKYPEITQKIKDRIDFELQTIKKIGYPGYFLITQDFTNKAREMGVAVGPGRGSAAGSVVAYCTGITNVDPIVYNLLFERFLNPDRVSLPDIDIDLDDEGRDRALNYVIEKYGRKQVAQITTYGMMAAKSSIRDAARVMELPLAEANYLAKLVPDKPGTSLAKAFTEVKELNTIKEGSDIKAQVLKQAAIIEGSLRNTATHACGVIITPCDLESLVPMARSRDSEMLVTQFDNSVVEQAGMLKMDFLGLTTLTVIKTALANIKRRRQLDIDIDRIPLDDEKTFRLYQRGDTGGTFQFESDGMKTYLKQLKPDKLEDLIAMNALYRPGPMEYIPNFIARKNGKETIHYDLPEMEFVLKETYGITVYQEQVMLLSQQLAGFSKGDADVLRKAMGKKQKEELDTMKSKFIEGCNIRGHKKKIAEKIWKDWEAFAQYAFNKSHSTCYSLIAYQTAYLKANYSTEYMAALLTHSRHNLDKITFFIEECRKQNIHVLGPDINESGIFFEVNEKNQIRFGLGAVKGIGEAAAQEIIDEREKKGNFKTVFDLVMRLDQYIVNKKILESLALSGSIDCFSDFHRRQFVAAQEGDATLTEKLIRYAVKMKREAASKQGNLFGGLPSVVSSFPKSAAVTPFSEIEKLHFEKEMVGVYISGHPLDSFQFEMDSFCNALLADLNKLEDQEGKKFKIGGMVSSTEHKMTRHGKPFGKMCLEDHSGKFEFLLWSEDYLKFKSFLMPGLFLCIEGMVVRKTWGEKNLEFKTQKMELLNELAAKRTKKLQLKINGASVGEDMIDQIEKLCREFTGDCPLYLNIQDEKKKINLDLLSRKYKVNPENEMIKALKEINGLDIGAVY